LDETNLNRTLLVETLDYHNLYFLKTKGLTPKKIMVLTCFHSVLISPFLCF